MASWADRNMYSRLVPDRSVSRQWVKVALVLLDFSFLVVALANPQVGTRVEKAKRTGGDVAICLDVSNSMMAEDIQPNRLESAKRTIGRIVAGLKGDRVSLVVFAGESFINVPLTSDYSALKLFLDEVDCEMVHEQGTAIGDAIDMAMRTFGYDDAERQWERNKGRAIIVISDGENHEDDAVGAARRAAREGVRVCTIGMGLPNGTPIPIYDKRQKKSNYKRDASGSIVMTRLNEQMLREVADAGHGVFIRPGNTATGIGEVMDVIDKLEATSEDEMEFSSFVSKFYYPLFVAVFCFVLEVLIFERRNRKWKLSI